MTEARGFRTDEHLFALARTVLSDAGFTQKEVALHNAAVLLAENAYCIVALATTPTVDDLIAAEPQVEALLHSNVEREGIGPKLWDAYVVLLTQERPSDQRDGLRPLFKINYDTRGFRRMARAGVEPTIRGVRNALTPFVEPVRLEDTGLATPPLVALVAALITHGVNESVAGRAIEIYKQGGRLGDAL